MCIHVCLDNANQIFCDCAAVAPCHFLQIVFEFNGKFRIESVNAAFLGLLCFALSFVTVLLRLFSGVHWLTDVVAGVLLSTALLELYAAVIGPKEKGE